MFIRIKNLREDNDYTQKKMAEILHISQAQYSKYESGKSELTAQTLRDFAQHFNVSTDYLLELSDIKSYNDISPNSNKLDRLINYFNQLSVENQDIALGDLSKLVKNQKYEKVREKDIG